MNLGTYMVSAFALIVAMVGGIYMLYPDNHTISMMGITLTLPIAGWVALPLLLLYFMTILHIAYHSTRNYFQNRRWQKDAQTLKDALYWSLMHEPKPHNYTIDKIKEGAVLLNASTLNVTGNIQGLNDKLADALETIEEIKSGKYVDLSQKKLDKKLSNDNPWVVKNQINRLHLNQNYVEEVLFAKDNYNEAVLKEAMDIAVSQLELYKIKKYSALLRDEHFSKLIERLCNKDDSTTSMEMLEYFISLFKLNCKRYMLIAKSIIKRFSPDENLTLFKKLIQKDEVASNAYLYLLFEYEMLDTVQTFLEEHDEYEFKPYRAYLILKRNKHNFKIDDIIDTSVVCK